MKRCFAERARCPVTFWLERDNASWAYWAGASAALALRQIANRFGLLRYVWHPTLLVLPVYIIVLSSSNLIVAR